MRLGLFVHGFAAFSLLLIVSSCGKDNDDADEAQHITKSAVTLDETVAPEGCLSIPLYYQQIRTLDPRLSALQATTKMSFSAKNGVRHNYELLSSLGGFQFEDVSIYKLQQLQSVTQSGCDSFTFGEPDGTEKVYKVKEKSRQSITGETDKGERLTYRWISPTQLEITTRFISYDVPCGSEKNAIFVDQTKIYDWSMANSPQVATDSPLAIDRDYLARIAEATGKNVNDFYVSGNEGALSSDQLRAIPATAPRADLLACSVAPPAPDEPHDGDSSGNNGDDGSGDNSGDNGGANGDNGGNGDGTPPPPTPHDGIGSS